MVAVPRLRRSDCGDPGIARRRRGRGFEFVDPDGARVDDPDALDRIRELAIPPAWKDVWICLDPLGHLQATGIDDAGRKQYRYHDHWRTRRDREKFGSMIEFGRSLPALRRRVRRDLRADEELTRRRALACATRLLDLGFFRIGSEDYAASNESYGLATMLKRHVTVSEDEVLFDYPAKSGQRRIQAIADDDVRENGRWADVRSADINEYVKAVTARDFSAKDFRTWNATVLAAVAVAADEREPTSRTAHKRIAASAVKTVAAYLGNTPAVARASYIDPRVFDRMHSGWTIAGTLAEIGEPDLGDPRKRTRLEAAVLDLLEGE
jgi:DNA topoisomerase IB